MRYQSTRNHSISVTPQEAVLHGLAEDGGLFVPSEPLPLLKSEDYLNKSYQDTAQNVLSILLDGYSKDELHRSITSAYDTRFNSTDIVPLTKVSDGWLMELWHGPTSAFKDIALTIQDFSRLIVGCCDLDPEWMPDVKLRCPVERAAQVFYRKPAFISAYF